MRLALARFAQDEAPPDIEVAIEAEPLVQRAALPEVGAPERHRVALHRVRVAGRSVLEPAQVG